MFNSVMSSELWAEGVGAKQRVIKLWEEEGK